MCGYCGLSLEKHCGIPEIPQNLSHDDVRVETRVCGFEELYDVTCIRTQRSIRTSLQRSSTAKLQRLLLIYYIVAELQAKLQICGLLMSSAAILTCYRADVLTC